MLTNGSFVCNMETFEESCVVPLADYFWLNDLHPTFPIHEVLASEVAELLSSGPNVCG